jgi:hypothetical protein
MDNLPDIIGVTLGLMFPLVPVLGFTLRFTLKPLIEAYARARSPMGEIPNLLARIRLLEAQVAALQPHLHAPVSMPASSELGEPMPRITSIERI